MEVLYCLNITIYDRLKVNHFVTTKAEVTVVDWGAPRARLALEGIGREPSILILQGLLQEVVLLLRNFIGYQSVFLK